LFSETCTIITLNASIYPEFKDAILHRFASTPVTMAKIGGTTDGQSLAGHLLIHHTGRKQVTQAPKRHKNAHTRHLSSRPVDIQPFRITSQGWSVMFALSCILIVLLIWLPDPLLLIVWLAETLILAWTHRLDLRCGFHLRPWLARVLQQTKN
jgi:hypothetical protein